MAHTQRSSLVVFLFLSLVLLSTHALDTGVKLIHVRLADGVDRSPEAPPPSSSSYLYPPSLPQHPSSTAATKIAITRPPARPYGPRLLRGLAGEIFSVTEGGYHYKLNMFDSVSQRKTTENEPVLLGVWDRWEVVEREEGVVVDEKGKEREKALSFRMVYTDGATCMANTSIVRTVMVDFLCAASPTPRADDAASAAVADDGDAICTPNNDDSTGMRLVDQEVKAREEGRIVREGESAAADMVHEVQQQQQHQQQHLSTATATAMPTTMETEAASSFSLPTSPPSLPPPPPQPQEEVVDFRLSDASEPSICLYHLTLHSPIPCAVLQKELASFAVHDLVKGEEEEEEEGAKRGGGGTKRQRKKKSKGKKGERKRGMAPLMEGAGRWLEGLWGKAVRAAAKSIASSNNTTTTSFSSPSSSSSSSSVCTCPCPVDTAAATTVAVGGEVGEERKGKGQIEALVHEVSELRSQLADFLEEMRGGKEGGREGCAGPMIAPVDGDGEVA